MPRPRFVSCPLCGRGFGSASIGIHVPQCYDKALQRWRLDPTSSPRPVMPACMSATMASSSSSTHKVTRRSDDNDDDSRWRVCGAGTTAARSIRHRTDATTTVGASSSSSSSGGALTQQLLLLDEQAPVNPNLHPCSKCGRTFNYDRIRYHESVCKGDSKRSVFASAAQRTFVSGDTVYENVACDSYSSRSSTMRRRGGGGGNNRSRSGGRRGDATAAPRPRRATSKHTANNNSNNMDDLIAPAPASTTTWRQQHEAFIAAIRSARVADAQAKRMWGGGSSGSVVVSPASRRASRPVAPPRVPPSMVRHDMMHKMNIASGGRAARATAGVIATPGTRATVAPPSRASTSGTRATLGGGGGGRILNDNTTSLGMLQAFGRA